VAVAPTPEQQEQVARQDRVEALSLFWQSQFLVPEHSSAKELLGHLVTLALLATASHRIQGTTLVEMLQGTTLVDMPKGITLVAQGITLVAQDTTLVATTRLDNSITPPITREETVSTQVTPALPTTLGITILATSTQIQEIRTLEIRFLILEIRFLILGIHSIIRILGTHSIIRILGTHFTILRMRAEREIQEIQETLEMLEAL